MYFIDNREGSTILHLHCMNKYFISNWRNSDLIKTMHVIYLMWSSFIYWGVCAQHLSTIGIANSGLQFIKNIYMYVVILASVHSFFVYIRVSTDQWGSSYSGHNNYNIDWELLKVYPRQHSMKGYTILQLNCGTYLQTGSSSELFWLAFVCHLSVGNSANFSHFSPEPQGQFQPKFLQIKFFFQFSNRRLGFFLLINVMV